MRSYLDEHEPAAFEPDQVKILVGAFDRAWQELFRASLVTDANRQASRQRLAKILIGAAKSGILNEDKLAAEAVREFASGPPS